MNKQYTVFSVHHQPATVMVTLPDESSADAIIDSVEIQLVPSDSGSGTIKLSVTGQTAIADAEALFKEGSTITATFAAAE